MAFYKTKGIIIKRASSGEADRIITIFAENLGKIRVAGRGTRYITSKLASELDLFDYTDFLIASGKTLDVITGAVAIKRFPFLKQDLKRLRVAEYLAKLINNFSAESHPASLTAGYGAGQKDDKELFSLFKKIFYFLEKEERDFDPFWILRNFEWEFLSESGFKPKLYNCSHCHKKLKPEKNYLDLRGHGIVCFSCGRKNREQAVITNNAIKILRMLENREFDKLKKIKLAVGQKQEIKRTLQYFLESI